MYHSWDQKIDLIKQNLNFENFFRVLTLDRDQPAAMWVEGDNTLQYDYEEFHSRVMAVAARIEDARFGRRDGWVGLCVTTCIDWPVLFWGLLASGRKPLLLDPTLKDAPLTHLMTQAGADAVIVDKLRPELTQYTQAVPRDLTEGAYSKAYSPEWADRIALCTSGTTATSRVYVYDGRAICLQAVAFMEQQRLRCMTNEKYGHQRTLCFLPLNHIFGLMTNMIPTALEGNPQVYLHDRAPETILKTCRTAKVELIMAVPLLVNGLATALNKKVAAQPKAKQKAFQVLQSVSLFCQRVWPEGGMWLAKHVLFKGVNAQLFGPSLRQIALGGASAPAETLRTIAALGYCVSFGYGMTETAVTAYDGAVDMAARLSGCSGQLLPIAQAKIADNGELIVGCEAIHIGQLRDGKLLPPDLDENGMFHTGDIVHFDKRNRLHIDGRIKDVIIGASGENIYPDEVEDYYTTLPGVDAMTVIGTGPKGKEQVTLVLCMGEKENDAHLRSQIAQELSRRNASIPANKQATLVLVTAQSLPLSGSMKVKRVNLRKDIESGVFPCSVLEGVASYTAAPSAAPAASSPAPAAAPEEGTAPAADADSVEKKVCAIFAEALNLDQPAAPTAHFIRDLGGDSLQMLTVMLRVEESFGVLLSEEDTQDCTCARDVARVICQKMGAAQASTPAAAPEKKPQGTVQPITRVEDMPEYQELEKRLDAVRDDNPYFVCHDSPLLDTSVMNGNTVLNFGSYNYASMSGRKETVEAAKAAADLYGTSASGSRLLGGEKKLHEDLEKAIAAWKHTEAALVLVSGHATNVTFVGNFCGKDDLILYDALAHNSIHEGVRMSDAASKAFPHNDYEALENILRAQRNHFAKVLIVCEGAYSMDGDIAPIPEYVRIKKAYGCFLMVDEAHSACVLGPTGAGVDEYFGLNGDDIDIKMGTLSKGLGTCGGYLAGSAQLIEYLRYTLPGFVFSVGMAPPLAAASLKAIQLLQSDPTIMQNLHRNINLFLEEAHKRNLNTCLAKDTAICPILVGRDEDAFELSTALGRKGVFVPPAVYPAVPRNSARLRFCVISAHQPEQIIRALDLLVETAAEMNISLPPMA